MLKLMDKKINIISILSSNFVFISTYDQNILTGLRSAVGNMPDCRSRGREFHTFVEIDHEIISMAIPLPSAVRFKKGYCQLQAKICAQSTG